MRLGRVLSGAIFLLAGLAGGASADQLRFQSWGGSSAFGHSHIVPPLRSGGDLRLRWHDHRTGWDRGWDHRHGRHSHGGSSVVIVVPPVQLQGGVIHRRSRIESRFIVNGVPQDHVVVIDREDFSRGVTIIVPPVVVEHGLALSPDRSTGLIVVLPPHKPAHFD